MKAAPERRLREAAPKRKERRLRYESGSEKGWRKAPPKKALGSDKGGCKIGCEKDGCVIGTEGDCENQTARTKLKRDEREETRTAWRKSMEEMVRREEDER